MNLATINNVATLQRYINDNNRSIEMSLVITRDTSEADLNRVLDEVEVTTGLEITQSLTHPINEDSHMYEVTFS